MTTPGSSGRTSARRRRDRWVAESATLLGTILLEPGTTVGDLRIDVHGLADGSLVDEATLVIPPDARGQGTFDSTLSGRSPRTPTATASQIWSMTARPFPILARPAVAPTAGPRTRPPRERRRSRRAGTPGSGRHRRWRCGWSRRLDGRRGGTDWTSRHGRRGGTIRGGRRRGTDRTSRHGRRRGTDRTIGRGRRDGTRGCGRRDERRRGTDRTIGRGRRGGTRGRAAAGRAAPASSLKGPPAAAPAPAPPAFARTARAATPPAPHACNSCATGTCTEVTNAPDDPECPEPIFACNKKGQCIISLSSN